jgi:hypothetical protein
MIYWEITAVFGRSTRSSVVLVLCGIPFLLAAGYLLLGRFFVRRWSLARTSYAITDRRAVSITPALRAGTTVRSVWFASYPRIERPSARSGRGTIVVGDLHAGPRSFATDPGWPSGGRVAAGAVIFNGIDAPDSVYALLNDRLAAGSTAKTPPASGADSGDPPPVAVPQDPRAQSSRLPPADGSNDDGERRARAARRRDAFRIARLILLLIAGPLVGVEAHRAASASSGLCMPDNVPHTQTQWSSDFPSVLSSSRLASLVGAGVIDEQGLQVDGAAWSDNPKLSSLPRESQSGTTLGGYEIRWWSPDSQHELADLFIFETETAAQRWVQLAATTHCRRDAHAAAADAPRGARTLVWRNPLGYMQADVFFSNGNRAYRITDAPPGPPYEPALRNALAVAKQLACQLPDANCARPPTDPLRAAP